MTKIVCISDTHCQLNQVKVPDGDILIHCGDWTMLGEQQEIIAFGKHLRKLPHKHKIIIPGNHDLTFDKHHKKFHKDRLKWLNMDKRTQLKINESFILEGIHFYASSLVPPIGNPYRIWAFESNEIYRLETYSQINSHIDILISHSPPRGIMDGSHCGCKALKYLVDTKKPQYHVFGHYHEGYGITKINETTFVNASICTREYKATNKPLVIEVEK